MNRSVKLIIRLLQCKLVMLTFLLLSTIFLTCTCNRKVIAATRLLQLLFYLRRCSAFVFGISNNTYKLLLNSLQTSSAACLQLFLLAPIEPKTIAWRLSVFAVTIQDLFCCIKFVLFKHLSL